MAFNHYAKLKRIIADYWDERYIVKINKPTKTKWFDWKTKSYDCYYRLYFDELPIKYGKFQQLDKLAKTLWMTLADMKQKIRNSI